MIWWLKICFQTFADVVSSVCFRVIIGGVNVLFAMFAYVSFLVFLVLSRELEVVGAEATVIPPWDLPPYLV